MINRRRRWGIGSDLSDVGYCIQVVYYTDRALSFGGNWKMSLMKCYLNEVMIYDYM
jgi:hypothetical protein